MGKFVDIFNEIIKFNDALDDGDNLHKFFGVLERFNNNKPFDIDLKKKIEQHFNHLWSHNKNAAIQAEKDLEIFEQIPEDTRDMLYHKFLFHGFLVGYKKYFTFVKKYSNV